MAQVKIEFNEDVEGYGLDLDIEDNLKEFLNKYSSELGEELINAFYERDGDDINVLTCLESLSISTHDEGQQSKAILNLISKTVGEDEPGFSLGHDGFEDKFYENLYNIIGEVMIGFKATVVGYGDEYTDCYYSLTDKGWNVDYADLYVWNEDAQEYEESS